LLQERAGFVCLIGFVAVHDALVQARYPEGEGADGDGNNQDDEQSLGLHEGLPGIGHSYPAAWKRSGVVPVRLLLDGLGVDFNFNVVIEVVVAISVGRKAHVAGFGALGVDEQAFAIFKVLVALAEA
jgi:hypothetical protein